MTTQPFVNSNSQIRPFAHTFMSRALSNYRHIFQIARQAILKVFSAWTDCSPRHAILVLMEVVHVIYCEIISVYHNIKIH